MVDRHADVLALYGLWVGIALVFASVAPMLALGVLVGTTVVAGMFVLAGAVVLGQGVVLCASADLYVGRYLSPPPVGRAAMDNRRA